MEEGARFMSITSDQRQFLNTLRDLDMRATSHRDVIYALPMILAHGFELIFEQLNRIEQRKDNQ